MSIEHSLIPAGEQHVVANWQAATVADLDNITVTFADIGKQAWVQGIGHFTLANSAPITWEGASAGVANLTYTAGTKLLTITDTAGATFTATLDGLNGTEVAALITAHAGAADPHGDRAYSVQRTNHAGTQLASTISDFGTSVLAVAQAKDATLTALAGISGTAGLLVQTTADNFTQRTLASGVCIEINNASGAGGDPTINNTGRRKIAVDLASGTRALVVNSFYSTKGKNNTTFTLPSSMTDGDTIEICNNFNSGSPIGALATNTVTSASTRYIRPKGTGSGTSLSFAFPETTAEALAAVYQFTWNATDGCWYYTRSNTTTSISDSLFRVQDDSDATKQLAFEVSGIATATTCTWTAPNAAINFGDLPAIATTSSNTLSGTRNQILGGSSNTVSGTDNVMIGCDSSKLSTTGVTAIGVTGVNEYTQFDSLRNGAVIIGSNLKTVAANAYDRLGQAGLTIYTNYQYIGDYTTGYIDVTTDGSGSAGATTCIPLHLYSAFASSASVHEVEVVIMHGTDPTGYGGITPIGCVVAKRRVSVFKNSAGTSFTSAVETVGTDVSLGTVSTTYTITLQVDTANNRAFPRITKTGGSAPESRTAVSCTCKSHYTSK